LYCFLKALTARLHLRGGCEVEPAPQSNPNARFSADPSGASRVKWKPVLAAAPTPKPPRHPTTRPGDKRLTLKLRGAATETISDRHAPTPRRSATAKQTTNLVGRPSRHPNCCEFETWRAVSDTLTRLKHQPHRPSDKTNVLHAAKTRNRRRC
jgi:hypothetical protein